MKPSARDVQRRLALVPYLQGKQGISVAEVAREFGVTARVIRKDVEQLMMTGVGSYGGDLIDVDLMAFESDDRIYISNADFMTRPLRINASEAAALVVGLRALRDTAAPEQAALVDGALEKLQSAIDDHVAASVEVVVPPIDRAVTATVDEALTRERRLEIRYVSVSRDTVSTRQVDPIATFTRDGQAYLEAWCHRAGGQRFFRIDRIEWAQVLDVPVAEGRVNPAGSRSEFFSDGETGLTVELEVRPEGRWIIEYYDAEIIDDVTDPQRWRVRLLASDEAWVRRLVLRLGGDIRIISPLTAREQVIDHARAGLAAYDEVTHPTEMES